MDGERVLERELGWPSSCTASSNCGAGGERGAL